MLELRVLTYGGKFSMDRFDSLIAQALGRLTTRLAVIFDDQPDTIGKQVLRCGAEFEGLRGDCFIVENVETGAFKIVDFQDSDASPAVQLAPSPYFRGAMNSMYHRPRIERLVGQKAELIKPGYFMDQEPLLTQYFRGRARNLRHVPLDNRLYFRGTILKHATGDYLWQGQPFRQVAVVLGEKYPSEVDISDQKLERTKWFLEAARHRVVLALPGHPWCYREFEMFSLGIPVLAYPWAPMFESAAMPTEYIATRDIPRTEVGFAVDPEEGADAIIQAHREALRYPERTEYFGRAAQRWYHRNLDPSRIASGILQWLNCEGAEWHASQPAPGALVPANS